MRTVLEHWSSDEELSADGSASASMDSSNEFEDCESVADDVNENAVDDVNENMPSENEGSQQDEEHQELNEENNFQVNENQADHQPERKRKIKSWVWGRGCFKKLPDGKAECLKRSCGQVFTKASTSTLAYHLERVHKMKKPDCALTIKPCRKKPTQPTLRAFGVRKVKSKKAYFKKINCKIAEMIAGDMRPYSIVNGRGFKNLLAFIVSGFEPAHRTTFSRKFYSTV